MTTPQVAAAGDDTRPGEQELEVLLAELLRLREFMVMQADDLALLKRVVETAKQYFKDPEKFDQAVRETLGDDSDDA